MADKLPLALLPGLLCDDALWQHQIAGLSDIADCWVADFTTQDSIDAMVDSVLAAMPERFALAGLSMGGYVALELIARAPDRVDRLALIDTKAQYDTEEQASRRRGLIELAEKGQFKGVAPRLLPLFIHEGRLDDEDLAGVITAMAEHVGKESFISQQRAILARRDNSETLLWVGVPTLIACGRQDLLTPLADHELMAAAIPGSELLVVEDCGHLAPLERPEPVTAAMRTWLAA